MTVDSQAVFQARVRELGLQAHSERFAAAGWTTYSNLAFSTGYARGNADEELFNREVIVLGRPKLRRLFVESYTLAAADLRRRV